MTCKLCGKECTAMTDISTGQTGYENHKAVSTCCHADIEQDIYDGIHHTGVESSGISGDVANGYHRTSS